MNTVKAWFKQAIAGWSPIAGVLDTLIGILVLGIGGSVVGILRGLGDVPWGWAIFISICVSVAICAAVLLWQRTAERREEATDVLRILAFEGRRTLHLSILCPMLAPSTASDSSADCCAITTVLRHETLLSLTAKHILEHKQVRPRCAHNVG